MWNLIAPLFRLGYWFNLAAVPFLPVVNWFLMVVIGLAIVGGVACFTYFAKQEKERDMRIAYRRAGTWLVSFGLTGFVLWFLTWELIPYLSMRIFWVVWLVCFAVWKWSIITYVRRTIPAQRAAHAQRAEYDKWLPKPKK